MKKKLILLFTLLSFAVLVAAVLNTVVWAEAETSGFCGAEGDGENLWWKFDPETGTLTIEGEGEMADYNVTQAPWKDYEDRITTVNISNGVTSIGMYAFRYYKNLTSIMIGENITSIGDSAFLGCSALIEVYFNAIEVADLDFMDRVFSDAGIA